MHQDKVLLIKLGGIGDVIMALPILQSIKLKKKFKLFGFVAKQSILC